jgi:hypothetical protein
MNLRKILFFIFYFKINFTSFIGSRISPSSSLSKSYGFFLVVDIINDGGSLFPLIRRVLLCDDESDD